MNASHRGYCDYVSIRYDANAGAIITDTTAWTEVATTKISYFMTGWGVKEKMDSNTTRCWLPKEDHTAHTFVF